MKKYYSLRELAAELDIPKSTIVKYKDYFNDYLPTFGEGKRKKYDESALEALREVRKLREDENRDWLEIKDMLAAKYDSVRPLEQSAQLVPQAPQTIVHTVQGPSTEYLEYLVNVLAGEVVKLAGNMGEIKKSIGNQAAAISKIEKKVEATGRNLEAVAIEMLKKDATSDRAQIRKLAAGIGKEFAALKASVKSIADKAADNGSAAKSAEIERIAQKVETLVARTGADPAKQAALEKENELLKRKLKEIILKQRETAAKAPVAQPVVVRQPAPEFSEHRHESHEHFRDESPEDHSDEYEAGKKKRGGLFSFRKKR